MAVEEVNLALELMRGRPKVVALEQGHVCPSAGPIGLHEIADASAVGDCRAP